MKFKASLALFLPLVLLPAAALAGGSSCVTGDCHPALGLLAQPHQPVAAGECLSCHVQNRSEHPLKNGNSFSLKADGAALCQTCHPPLGKRRIVHSPVKEGDCRSCHQPHGGANSHLLTAPAPELCFGCHDDSPFRLPHRHDPTFASCTDCHSPHETNEKRLLLKPVRDLCTGCHEGLATQLKSKSPIHTAVRKNPCTSCHQPHASAEPHLLQKKVPDLCWECHGKLATRLEKAAARHAPLGEEKSCANCHLTHAGGAGLLKAEEKTLCLECHGDQPAVREMGEKKNLHGPLREGKCAPCHDPHGSDSVALLKGGYPSTFYYRYREGAYDSCLKCHQKYLLKFRETSIYTAFRDGKRNLHSVHVVEPQKGRTCRVCHEPHAGDGPKLVRQDGIQFGEWMMPIQFQRTANGGSCAPGCHQPFAYDRERPVGYRRETQTHPPADREDQK